MLRSNVDDARTQPAAVQIFSPSGPGTRGACSLSEARVSKVTRNRARNSTARVPKMMLATWRAVQLSMRCSVEGFDWGVSPLVSAAPSLPSRGVLSLEVLFVDMIVSLDSVLVSNAGVFGGVMGNQHGDVKCGATYIERT